MNIAVITARGGSKRIPKKNIKDFLGKPIIAYSIEAALKCGLFDEVMVSTDDDEIADISLSYGAKVPFRRSAKTSDDYATTSDVLKEVINEYDKRGRNFDWLCCIYPTAPFVTSGLLIDCMDEIKSKNADALTPVVKFSFPPQRAFVLDENGCLLYKWPENASRRSQDLEPFYHDAGQFYFMKAESFLNTGKKFTPPIAYILDELYVQDIDNVEDWEIAEFKYKFLNNIRSKE